MIAAASPSASGARRATSVGFHSQNRSGLPERARSRRCPWQLLFRQATWHATLLHPFLYVIDFKGALNFGEAQVSTVGGPEHVF
jgi:hypothetical protein